MQMSRQDTLEGSSSYLLCQDICLGNLLFKQCLLLVCVILEDIKLNIHMNMNHAQYGLVPFRVLSLKIED